MTERIKQVIKRGWWLYAGSVPCEIQIIKTNYFEQREPEDDRAVPGYPPRDDNGFFYYANYRMSGSAGISGSVSNLFGSVDDAVRCVEATLKGPIKWN